MVDRPNIAINGQKVFKKANLLNKMAISGHPELFFAPALLHLFLSVWIVDTLFEKLSSRIKLFAASIKVLYRITLEGSE